MQPPRFSIIPATVFAGVALGFATLAGNTNLPEQNITWRTLFPAGVATHETRAASEDVLQSTNANETDS